MPLEQVSMLAEPDEDFSPLSQATNTSPLSLASTPSQAPRFGSDLMDLSNETEAVTGVKPGVDFRAPTTFAENYLMGVDPTFQQKFFKPGSSDRYTGTFVNTYRVADGKMVPIEATPADIAKGDVIFYVGGAPGSEYAGESRVGQAYTIKDGVLTPVGEASSYKAPEKTPFFKEFLLEGVLPMVLAAAGPAGLFEGLGGALSGGAFTGSAASSLGSGVFNLGSQILAGKDPIDALKSTALSYGAGQIANQLNSMLPQELGSVGRQAVSQLITAGKIDPLALATTAGVDFAADTLAQETGISKASAGQLIRSGLQFAQGNQTGALSSLISSGALSSAGGDNVTKPQDQAAFLDANASPLGVGALSPIPAEDEQIALSQLNQAATSLVSDYVAAKGGMEPTDLAAALSTLKDPYGMPLPATEVDRLVAAAQTQLDTQLKAEKLQGDTLAVLSDYTDRDSDLSREVAYERLVAAGNSGDRANEILLSVDAQVEANRAARAATATQNQAAINAGAGEFAGADQRAAVTAGAGEFTGADTAQAINQKISDAKTFGEAYSQARNAFGAGATFNWQGKLYSTDTFQENPALGLVPVAGSGRGQAAGKTAEQEAALLATAEELKKINPVARAALLDSASIDYGAASPEGNAQGLSQTTADKLIQSVIPVNAIKTAFGMTSEAAGNTLKAFGTIGESLGFNTAQMSDYGRKLENIAQEFYPQALKDSESEIKNRFANANSAADIGRALKDSVLNNPGAVAKMIGVEGLQELPNIALALATGGTSALIRYGGMLAGLGLDVVESAGLQGAQKVEEGLSKGLTRAQAVKGAVDDMKAAGAVTAVMTAAADRIPFGGTVAKTLIKGSAGEGIEEYVIARATGQDHMGALRQAAFGALIGGPTEASLQGAGNLTNVVINGDTMIGTYEDGTKVSISEPSGATDLKIDILKPTDTSITVSNSLTSDLTAGLDLSTSINNAVSNNITADLSGTIDSTIKAVVDNGADLSQGVTDLTSSAVSNTGDTTAVINNVVSSLKSNGTDLNANAGSVVAGAVSGGATVTAAVDTTLKAVTANGGSVADSAASIITTVSTQSGGDTTKVADAATAVVGAAIASGTNVTAATSNAVDSAIKASGGSTDVVTQVVGDIASKGNNDATAAAVASAVTNTNDTSAAVGAALSNGGDASVVISTASNAAVAAGADASTAVSNTLSSALSNNVDTTVAVDSTIKGALDAGADVSTVVGSAVTTSLDSGVDTTAAVTSVITAALNNNADTASVIDSTVTAAITSGADTGSVVDSTIKAAVTAGTDSTTAIDSTLTAVANAGGDVAQAVGSAVDASLAAGADTSQTIIGAVSAAVANGGDASAVVTNVVDSAVTNGTSLADASASSIATAIVSGADADTVIKAVTDSNSGLTVESGADGGVTTVVASDGSNNTQVVMDAGSQTITTTSTDTKTGNTEQVVIQGDTTTKVITDNTGSVTQIVSNPDRDQIVTTTWNADNTVTVTTKTGDTPETTETLSVDEATVKPQVDPVTVSTDVQTTPASATPKTTKTSPTKPTTKPSVKLPQAAGLSTALPLSSSDYELGLLKSSGDTALKNPLEALMERVEQMNQIDPSLAAVMSQRLGIQQAPTFTYGQESSIDDILGLNKAPKEEETAFAQGGFVAPLRAINPQFMNRGGALGREDFREGKHVAGEGDGQSDDIPAWLADGEFVFPADVVSALGNGSTKAGTDKLYEMMHQIRARARSTKNKDLPPPAHKSPLDYLKKGK